jgi:hypothetical protein
VVFRCGGPDNYGIWPEFKALPVVSASPVRRPKLTEDAEYRFEQEQELMKDKMRTVLRIAVRHGHGELVIGGFGTGSIWKNPVEQVATMWRDLLFDDREFRGCFKSILFAIDPKLANEDGVQEELRVYREVFRPASIFESKYSQRLLESNAYSTVGTADQSPIGQMSPLTETPGTTFPGVRFYGNGFSTVGSSEAELSEASTRPGSGHFGSGSDFLQGPRYIYDAKSSGANWSQGSSRQNGKPRK